MTLQNGSSFVTPSVTSANLLGHFLFTPPLQFGRVYRAAKFLYLEQSLNEHIHYFW